MEKIKSKGGMEKSNTELKTYTEEKLVRKQRRFQTTSLKNPTGIRAMDLRQNYPL